jgi:hypothetical protein
MIKIIRIELRRKASWTWAPLIGKRRWLNKQGSKTKKKKTWIGAHQHQEKKKIKLTIRFDQKPRKKTSWIGAPTLKTGGKASWDFSFLTKNPPNFACPYFVHFTMDFNNSTWVGCTKR